jgi:esterase
VERLPSYVHVICLLEDESFTGNLLYVFPCFSFSLTHVVVCMRLYVYEIRCRAVALLQPDRIAGLVVIDIAPVRYTPDEPHWQAVSDIIDALSSVVTVVPENAQKALSKRDVDAQLRPLIPDPALRAFCLTNFGANGQWTVPLSHIRNQLDTLAGFDVSTTTTTTTQQFAGDAFFIHGGQSKFVRHSHLDAISTYFPNHMLTTIRGAGHWVHAEAPEDTTALLQRFLDR